MTAESLDFFVETFRKIIPVNSVTVTTGKAKLRITIRVSKAKVREA